MGGDEVHQGIRRADGHGSGAVAVGQLSRTCCLGSPLVTGNHQRFFVEAAADPANGLQQGACPRLLTGRDIHRGYVFGHSQSAGENARVLPVGKGRAGAGEVDAAGGGVNAV